MSYYGYGRYGHDMPSGNLVRTHSGVDIFYNDRTGKFEAKIGQKVVRRATIKAVETEIGKRTTAKVVLMHRTGDPVTVVEKVDGNRWRREDGEIIRSYVLYQHDEALAAEIKAELARFQQEEGRHRSVMNELHQRLVPVHEMPELQPVQQGRRILAQEV